MPIKEDGRGRLLKPAEAAQMFRVNPKTLNQWARTYDMTGVVVYTPGGHARYYENAVRAIIEGGVRLRRLPQDNDLPAL